MDQSPRHRPQAGTPVGARGAVEARKADGGAAGADALTFRSTHPHAMAVRAREKAYERLVVASMKANTQAIAAARKDVEAATLEALRWERRHG